MKEHYVPGLSLVIIKDNRILSARAYGNREVGGTSRVTPETLFQAGSVSKVATAIAALMLVEKGDLSLDEDVNLRLKTWRLPETPLTQVQKVTVRRILSHTAGMSIHGFTGYSPGATIPSLNDILDGTGPVTSGPIRVTNVPGTEWRYSGGGYVVLQKLMLDVTGRPFPDLMSDLVLKPLEMVHSTFEQPLPQSKEELAASGHLQGRSLLSGKWNVYPEMSAAGLWTTPSDLAQMVIGIQKALAGASTGVISPEIAQWMTTPVLDHDGLGLFVDGPHNQIFSHGGRTIGFDTLVRASGTDGVIIMINTNDDSGVMNRICQKIWKVQSLAPSWLTPGTAVDTSIDPKTFGDYVGRYDLGDGLTVEITVENRRIYTQLTGQDRFEIFPSGPDTFFLKVVEAGIAFSRDKNGAVTELTLSQNGTLNSAAKLK